MGKKVVQHIRQSSVLTGQQIVCFNICQCFNAFPDALGAVIERLFNALFVGVLGLLDAFLELPPCFTVSCFFTAQLCTCSHTHALTATPLQTSPIHTSPPPKKSSLPPIMLRYTVYRPQPLTLCQIIIQPTYSLTQPCLSSCLDYFSPQCGPSAFSMPRPLLASNPVCLNPILFHFGGLIRFQLPSFCPVAVLLCEYSSSPGPPALHQRPFPSLLPTSACRI